MFDEFFRYYACRGFQRGRHRFILDAEDAAASDRLPDERRDRCLGS